ncbi:YxiG-like protein, partial [Streptomyces sp. NPDC000963]
MATAELQRILNEHIEAVVVHHGYTTYMRDYEVIINVWEGPRARRFTCGISSGTASRPDARR